MNKIEIYTQIIPSEENRVNNSEEKIFLRKKLEKAKQYLGLDALIIWADASSENLELLTTICTDLNIQTYLWYPILGTTPGYDLKKDEEVENFDGVRGYGKIACWDKIDVYPEKFEFACPNNELLIEKLFNIFKDRLDKYKFNGVFLDRIRFPSPANGFEMLFTCFCKSCGERFSNDFNEDLDIYKNSTKSHFKKLKQINYSNFKRVKSFEEIIFSDQMRNLRDFRLESIYRVVKKFSDFAKENNKKVGLDVFSPSLAGIVSQDYIMLSNLCDWIKPMIYCHSKGPAGIPLELYSLLKALAYLNSNLKESELIKVFERVLGINLPERIVDVLNKGVSENLLASEINKVTKLNLPKNVNIYPGFEAVQKYEICSIDEKILEKYLKEIVSTNVKGIVISWDLLDIPDENMKFMGEFLRKTN